jgi:DMSO/TMAO reductase YedYZ heme-binding membrane subunit
MGFSKGLMGFFKSWQSLALLAFLAIGLIRVHSWLNQILAIFGTFGHFELTKLQRVLDVLKTPVILLSSVFPLCPLW